MKLSRAHTHTYVYCRAHHTQDEPTPAASPAARRRDTTTALIVVLRLLQSKNVCLRETRNRHIQRIFSHLLALKLKFRLFEGCWQKSDLSPDHPSRDFNRKTGKISGGGGGSLPEAFGPVKEVASWERSSLRFVFWSWTLTLPLPVCVLFFFLGHWSDACLPRPAVVRGSRTRSQLFSTVKRTSHRS